MTRLLAGLLVALGPASAEACTWCVSSAFGDRTYGWPYVGLILAPFIVATVVTAVLVHHLVGFREVARRLRGRLARSTSEGETP